MNLISLITGAMAISILNALLPSHWLAFVLVGNAQGWHGSKIMKIALLAGSGHVTMTAILGSAAGTIAGGIVFYIGYAGTYITAGIPILLGLIYVFLVIVHKNSHNHSFRSERPDKATTTSLILMLHSSFSPGLG